LKGATLTIEYLNHVEKATLTIEGATLTIEYLDHVEKATLTMEGLL
jgi:hypothetical protein